VLHDVCIHDVCYMMPAYMMSDAHTVMTCACMIAHPVLSVEPGAVGGVWHIMRRGVAHNEKCGRGMQVQDMLFFGCRHQDTDLLYRYTPLPVHQSSNCSFFCA